VTLKWFRARAVSIAPALLLSLAALALPHIGDAHHDPDSDFALVVAHDPSGHNVSRPSSPDGETHHCAICHWSRIFRPLTQTAIVHFAVCERAGLVCGNVFRVAIRGDAAQPPLRAPPTSPARA